MPSFSPADLFPPAHSSSQAPLAVPASSVALLGPLPVSSLLHLALNHLRDDDDGDSYKRYMTSKAQGIQREEEDGGDDEDEATFFPSPNKVKQRCVLILTPDEGVLRNELRKENDLSLFGARRSAETASLLDLVDIRCLPTSAHFHYFLMTCYTPSSRSASQAHSAFLATNPRTKLDPSYLPYEPTLVILHAVSDYLEESVLQGGGIEAYASLLAAFLSTFRASCSRLPLLVLHDPLACDMSLPILPSHLKAKKKGQRRSEDAGLRDAQEEEEDDIDRIPLRQIAERFVDWVGEAEAVSSTTIAYNAPMERRYSLSLRASPYVIPPPGCEATTQVEYVVRQVQESEEGEEEGVRIEIDAT